MNYPDWLQPVRYFMLSTNKESLLQCCFCLTLLQVLYFLYLHYFFLQGLVSIR